MIELQRTLKCKNGPLQLAKRFTVGHFCSRLYENCYTFKISLIYKSVTLQRPCVLSVCPVCPVCSVCPVCPACPVCPLCPVAGMHCYQESFFAHVQTEDGRSKKGPPCEIFVSLKTVKYIFLQMLLLFVFCKPVTFPSLNILFLFLLQNKIIG